MTTPQLPPCRPAKIYQASAAENKFMLCQELNTCECAQHSTIIFSALHWQWRFLPQIEFMTSKPACNKLLLWGQHEYCLQIRTQQSLRFEKLASIVCGAWCSNSNTPSAMLVADKTFSCHPDLMLCQQSYRPKWSQAPHAEPS